MVRHSAVPVIGLLGGMGPEATVELMRRVVKRTPARDDDDHISMLVDNNPQVPSRIAAIVCGTGESPLPELRRMAKRLEAAGATVLAIACNTAHYYVPQIAEAVNVPLLDMIVLSADEVLARSPKHRRVGVLASTAVISLGLYEQALAQRGITAAFPCPNHQIELMAVIRAVKAGDTGSEQREAFRTVALELARTQIDQLLIACTELSIIADALGADVPAIDAMDVLVDRIVREGRANNTL